MSIYLQRLVLAQGEMILVAGELVLDPKPLPRGLLSISRIHPQIIKSTGKHVEKETWLHRKKINK